MRVGSERWIGVAVAGLILVAMTTFAAPQAGAAGPTVVVTPSSGLADFQQVQVTGSGFEPNALLEVYECRGGAVDESDCDANNADFIDIDSSGNVLPYTFWVDARIFLPDGTEVDCRNEPLGCEIGVGFLVDADEWPDASLEFDPALPLRPPVTATVTPNEGLVDGQAVAVHAEQLSFREEGFAFVCAVGTTDVGHRCDLDHLVRGVPGPDGTLELSLTVHPQFDPPLGDPIDCNTVVGACVVSVSWGFTTTPDRVTAVAIAFVATPTTTPTTTPTATPPAPVEGQATLTG